MTARPNPVDLDRLARRADDRRARVLSAMHAGNALVMTDSTGRETLVIVSGEMQHADEGPLRATYFRHDGPLGHITRKNLGELADDVARDIYPEDIRVASEEEVIAWTSTEEFAEGTARVAEVQEWHAARRRRNPARPNPPWTARAIALDWGSMHRAVGPALMPVLEPERAARDRLVVSLEELGCGAYGCVLETNDPSVVLKITTDSSEAVFAEEILPEAPAAARAGVVRYDHVLRLGSEHMGRPVYALWRQAASDVGKLGEVYPDEDGDVLLRLVHQEHREASTALAKLIAAGDHAGRLYTRARAVHPRSGAAQILARGRRAEAELAYALDGFAAACHALERSALGRVGAALGAFFRQGIFIADVHDGNVGRVPDAGGGLVWVITDPGNVVVLPEPWRT